MNSISSSKAAGMCEGDTTVGSDADTALQQQHALSSMRAAINAKLRQEGVYEQIRQLVHDKAAAATSAHRATNGAPSNSLTAPSDIVADTDGTQQSTDEESLIRDVLESEVVQQLLHAVRCMKLHEPPSSSHEDGAAVDDTSDDDDDSAVRASDMCLFLRVASGKAFVDQLLAGDDELGVTVGDSDMCTDTHLGQERSFFRVVATFQNQRFTSKDVPCCVDPVFDATFRFRIDKRRTRRSRTSTATNSTVHHTPYDVAVVSPCEALCLVDEPVQLDVVKATKRLVRWNRVDGAHWHETNRELLAVHRLDWRRVLCSMLQLVHLPVALVGKLKVPVGVLDVRADVLNVKRTAAFAREAAAFLNKETLQRNALQHAFYQYARRWWDEYRNDAAVAIGAQSLERKASPLRTRLVKLFAEDDDGRIRMVCKFLTPLRVPDAIRSPSEAARFVGLLPFATDPEVGGARDETWRSLPAFLSLGKGDAQDHALLLASLLLGCGLDAYVCIGTIAAEKEPTRGSRRSVRASETERGHVWVLTRGSSTSDDVVLWEATTGERHSLRDASARLGYCAVDCAFSNSQFFANLQPRATRLRDTSFAFEDANTWRALDAVTIADLPLAQPPCPLVAPDTSALPALERAWTLALKQQISTRRRCAGVTTRWSDELSFYLLPALNAYELERLYGVTHVDNALFQQSITRFVPAGHTFQGVPVLFHAPDATPDDAMRVLETNALALQLVELHARSVQFGVAVRCFAYPERRVVIWAMLAVSYESRSATTAP